jgi:hypothetical protein
MDGLPTISMLFRCLRWKPVGGTAGLLWRVPRSAEPREDLEGLRRTG